MKRQIQLLFSIFISSTIASAKIGISSRGQWQKKTQAGLDYLIYIPQKKFKSSASLMLGLHGCAQHAQDLADLANWENSANKNNMIVVLPDVPNGGVILGCWDYYGREHTETNRHNGPLIRLTESIIKDSSLKINKANVFVTGLSSGSGEAFVLGCLRPDLFTGVSLNAGPALGTDKNNLFQPNTTSGAVADFCKQLAGFRASFFAKQKMSIVVSDKDLMVNPLHSKISFEAMQKVYDLTETKEFDLSPLQGTNKEGDGILGLDLKKQVRLSYIVNFSLGHAFPSGQGQGRTEKYVNPFSINYPAYLAEFMIHQLL